MTTTLQESNGQYRLTIPKDIVKLEGFTKGQKFNIIKVQGYLALEPIQ